MTKSRGFMFALVVVLLFSCKGREAQVANPTPVSSEPASSAAAVPAPQPAAVPVQQAAATPSVAPPIGSQETNWKGISAAVTEFRRKGNTLTAKVRFTNGGSERSAPHVVYNEVYLIDTTGGKKYEVLKDENGQYIAGLRQGYNNRWYESVEPGQSLSIWMKFPAPPPDVKAITLQLPNTPPFEDIPIQD